MAGQLTLLFLVPLGEKAGAGTGGTHSGGVIFVTPQSRHKLISSVKLSHLRHTSERRAGWVEDG